MTGFLLVVAKDQLEAAGERYVRDGAAELRAERQRDVDGAMAFLLDQACAKFRKDPTPHREHHGSRVLDFVPTK